MPLPAQKKPFPCLPPRPHGKDEPFPPEKGIHGLKGRKPGPTCLPWGTQSPGEVSVITILSAHFPGLACGEECGAMWSSSKCFLGAPSACRDSSAGRRVLASDGPERLGGCNAWLTQAPRLRSVTGDNKSTQGCPRTGALPTFMLPQPPANVPSPCPRGMSLTGLNFPRSQGKGRNSAPPSQQSCPTPRVLGPQTGRPGSLSPAASAQGRGTAASLGPADSAHGEGDPGRDASLRELPGIRTE